MDVWSGDVLALDGDLAGILVLELLIWGIPLLLAVALIRRLPPERRRTWWIVAVACLVIVLDKAVDLQLIAMTVGKSLVHSIDPEMTHEGSRQWGRAALLGTLFVGACATLWMLVRSDRHLDRAKVLSLAGLVGVMAYLGVRLVPAVSRELRGEGNDVLWGSAIELVCCALVWTGLLMARCRSDTAS